MQDISDRMVRPLLFRDRISNWTNLFRPEPNGTGHRIFAFVSLLFSNLLRSKCCTHTFTIQRHYIHLVPFDDVMSCQSFAV